MGYDRIKKIEIDSKGRLLVYPEKERFDMIYREAREVNYDGKNKYLFTPKSREWSYLDWFKHIIIVLQDCNSYLNITENTEWINIPDDLKVEIEALFKKTKKTALITIKY